MKHPAIKKIIFNAITFIGSAFKIGAFVPFVLLINTVSAQQNDTLLKKLSTLRDSYINEIKSFSFKPSLAPPVLVLDNPRSFGNYDDEKNVLHTCDWNTLPPGARQVFEELAKNLNSRITAEQFFEISVHKWIFIHELGHWWRACQHVTADPYENEKAANRIDAAYWNEHDPQFYQLMLSVFNGIVNHSPSPVPTGLDKARYLNDNYQKLPGGAAYTWYQSIMIVEVSKEQPFETFSQAIQNAGKPLK
jgi:hypothetical protein